MTEGDQLGRAYVSDPLAGAKIFCDSPEGEALMAELDAEDLADVERRVDEWYAAVPSTTELLRDAITEALAAGASREQVAAVVREELRHGRDETTELFAAMMLRRRSPP